jgi:hypothetical protein
LKESTSSIFRAEKESKQESSQKQAASKTPCGFIHYGFFLGSFFDAEDGCDMLLRNGCHLLLLAFCFA